MIRNHAPAPPGRQQGVALISALVILVILTILGVTALSTTSLEQRMAVGVQEAQRAFEAAESGLQKTMNTPGAFDLYATNESQYSFGSATAEVATDFHGWSDPPRGSGYSAINFSSAHFKASSTGAGANGAKTTVEAGMYQITPKLGN